MQINWRRERKHMLTGFAVAYVALNIFSLLFDSGMESTPVDITVSVFDANNSGPVSQAVASWQEGAWSFDCQHVVDLLNQSAKSRSSEGGILSPDEGYGWRFALVTQAICDDCLSDEDLPMNVIGMTTEKGRLDFRTYFRRDLIWALPALGPIHTSDRLLQVDAAGYDSKLIKLRPEDFRRVEGQYRVNITVLLDPETVPACGTNSPP
jgi:hypothetical protein